LRRLAQDAAHTRPSTDLAATRRTDLLRHPGRAQAKLHLASPRRPPTCPSYRARTRPRVAIPMPGSPVARQPNQSL